MRSTNKINGFWNGGLLKDNKIRGSILRFTRFWGRQMLCFMESDHTYPCSAYDKIGGIVYFARMLDKIRLKAADNLPAAYHKNLGIGFDGRCCRFLNVTYGGVQQRVQQGGTDEDVLQWCFEQGRKPNDEEILIWNAFMTKRGWKDDNTEELNRYKAESGFSGKSEIQTLFDYYEFDEGRAK